MTPREIKITRAVLDVLHGRPALASAMLVHAEAELLLEEKLSSAEFTDVFRACDRQGWLVGVTSPLTGMKKWKLNDAGEAARLELNADS